MSASGPTNAGSFRRFCVAVRALSLALVAVLILPSLSLADHHPGPSAASVVQISSTPDGSTDTSPDHCLLCHVLCSCHAGLPVTDTAMAVLQAISVIEPIFSTDRQLASALDKRLQRPPRA